MLYLYCSVGLGELNQQQQALKTTKITIRNDKIIWSRNRVINKFIYLGCSGQDIKRIKLSCKYIVKLIINHSPLFPPSLATTKANKNNIILDSDKKMPYNLLHNGEHLFCTTSFRIISRLSDNKSISLDTPVKKRQFLNLKRKLKTYVLRFLCM